MALSQEQRAEARTRIERILTESVRFLYPTGKMHVQLTPEGEPRMVLNAQLADRILWAAHDFIQGDEHGREEKDADEAEGASAD